MSVPPFAERVSQAMRERGVTLRALCREVGLDASFFSKVLAGKRSPPVEEEVVRRIASSLALDPAELVVAAGRIPSEWRGVWADPSLFAKMHTLASGKTVLALPKREPASAPAPVSAPVPERATRLKTSSPALAPKASFGDELL